MGQVINKGPTETICVDSVGTHGFELTNKTTVIGPVIMFPHCLLSWNVESAADINEDSLSIFKIIQPKVEMLIIGFGEREHYTRQIQLQILSACRNLKLNYEAMATEDAVATFNFLSTDRRFVAGAFLPPAKLNFFGTDKTLEEMEAKREVTDQSISLERIPQIPPGKYKDKQFGQEET